MTRDYHVWTDEELWDLYCWSEAKRRVGKISAKAFDRATTGKNLSGVIGRARKKIDLIERRLGKTRQDRERAIREVVQ